VQPAKKPRVRCGLGFWWGKTRYNGSSSVPTRTRNWTANLEPLLTLARWVRFPDSMVLPSITSTCLLFFSSCSGTWWWPAKSRSINAIPVAPQSINACVCIIWSQMVREQIITKCFPSIDPSNTSTLLIENRKIPKHFKAFESKLFLSIRGSHFPNRPGLFPSPLNPAFLLSAFLPPLPPWRTGPSFSPHNPPPCG